jgi:hypothetical protein
MDDGGLQHSSLVFNTHSFSQEEVEMLRDWFLRKGIEAQANRIRRKRGGFYWTLSIMASGARRALRKMRPYAMESMLYKWEVPTEKWACEFCGEKFLTGSCLPGAQRIVTPEHPCCGAPSCRRQRRRQHREAYVTSIGGSAVVYARAKARLEKDPEKKKRVRQIATERQRERFQDPCYRAKHNEWRKEHREKMKAEGRPEKQGMKLTCQFCAALFRNTESHKVCRDSPIIYCTAPACLEKKDALFTETRLARAREKRKNRSAS